MKYLFILFISLPAAAQDQWFCTTESGKRQGDTIFACGTGEGMSEEYARKRALTNALGEFQIICEASTECRNRTTMVEPKRMTCTEASNGIWKCYRLVAITLGKR